MVRGGLLLIEFTLAPESLYFDLESEVECQFVPAHCCECK